MSRFGVLPVAGGWKVYATSALLPPVVETALARGLETALTVVDCWLNTADWRTRNADILQVVDWESAVALMLSYSYAGRACSEGTIRALARQLVARGWREPDGWCETLERWVDGVVWEYLEAQNREIESWFEEALGDAVLGNRLGEGGAGDGGV